MLTRILTIFTLLPLLLLMVFFLPYKAFMGFVGAVIVLCAWEWTKLLKLERQSTVIAYMLSVVVAISVIAWAETEAPASLQYLLYVGLIWWLICTIWVMVYPRGFRSRGLGKATGAIYGWLMLIPAWYAVSLLMRQHVHFDWVAQGGILVYVLFMIWAVDTGAYLAGRAFGGMNWVGARKLSPSISPNKTWAGVFGGIALSLATTAVALRLFSGSFDGVMSWLLISLVVCPISIVGDLTQSMFKRQANVKDTGNLLPGHGGMLDRLDSVLAASSFVAILIPCLIVGAVS